MLCLAERDSKSSVENYTRNYFEENGKTKSQSQS